MCFGGGAETRSERTLFCLTDAREDASMSFVGVCSILNLPDWVRALPNSDTSSIPNLSGSLVASGA